MTIIIPYTSTPLPVPPASQLASQIAHWNRGESGNDDIQQLRVMSIIRLLLPYVTFAPRSGSGGWDARPSGFKAVRYGWGGANMLDILDDLVADLTLIQPSMSRCIPVDPSSSTAVDVDITEHLPGFCRSAQLLLQYALLIARTATIETVRAYNPAAFPRYAGPPTTLQLPTTFKPQDTWTAPAQHHSCQCSGATLSNEQLLAIGRALTAEALARISRAAQQAAIDNTSPTLTPSQMSGITAIGDRSRPHSWDTTPRHFGVEEA